MNHRKQANNQRLQLTAVTVALLWTASIAHAQHGVPAAELLLDPNVEEAYIEALRGSLDEARYESEAEKAPPVTLDELTDDPILSEAVSNRLRELADGDITPGIPRVIDTERASALPGTTRVFEESLIEPEGYWPYERGDVEVCKSYYLQGDGVAYGSDANESRAWDNAEQAAREEAEDYAQEQLDQGYWCSSQCPIKDKVQLSEHIYRRWTTNLFFTYYTQARWIGAWNLFCARPKAKEIILPSPFLH